MHHPPDPAHPRPLSLPGPSDGVDAGHNPDLLDMRRRFVGGLVLAVPLLVLDLLGLQWDGLGWLELALATPVVFWCGWPFFVRAVASLHHRSPNMFTLIALGV